MRSRAWRAGILLMGLWAAWQPTQARAAIWPFSLFAKKTIVKRTKGKPGRPAYGNHIKQVKPLH